MRDDVDARQDERGPLEAAYRRATLESADTAGGRRRRDRLMAAVEGAPDAPPLAANEPQWRGMPRRAGLVAGVAVVLLSAGLLLRMEREGGWDRPGADLPQAPAAAPAIQAPVQNDAEPGTATTQPPRADTPPSPPARERAKPLASSRAAAPPAEKARTDGAPSRSALGTAAESTGMPSTAPVPSAVRAGPAGAPAAETAAAGMADRAPMAPPAAAVPQASRRASTEAELRAAADAAVDWARLGDRARLRSALDRGDDPNQVDAAGSTSLHYAVMRADTDMVRLLIERGANPDQPDRRGISPVALARTMKRDELIPLLQR